MPMNPEDLESGQLTPRLGSSKTWTPLPAEFIEKVQSVFQNEFKVEAARGEFLVEGRIYPEEVLMRVGYLESGRLKQINFEASMDLPRRDAQKNQEQGEVADSQKKSSLDRLYLCIDALGSVMDEYFEAGEEEEDIDIPRTWAPFDFEGDEVYLQYSTVNTKLEEEADRLLGLIDKQLVYENEPSEDALRNAEIDTDLALEIQKAIRNGTFRPEGFNLDQEEESEPKPN